MIMMIDDDDSWPCWISSDRAHDRVWQVARYSQQPLRLSKIILSFKMNYADDDDDDAVTCFSVFFLFKAALERNDDSVHDCDTNSYNWMTLSIPYGLQLYEMLLLVLMI